jgi:hypothetical protein
MDTDGDADDYPLVGRVWDVERTAAPLPDDYKETFDKEAAGGLAQSLLEYLVGYTADRNGIASWSRSENDVDGEAPDTSNISIEVYGEEAFNITHWPAELDDGRVVFDLIQELDSDHMITLARLFALRGSLDTDETENSENHA